ncbi:patatin-like phospholipase family protein [Metabacillus sp. GX 13764]|uniref:patatin-like phospholipase family protein n=1 Tax=Metabacillus kandeliae TaxID=2900151 RepID=UPI001E64FE22|nr:patatin-like phospholipase family protein [Metabacillus kandeliae]MCD7033188.1 patatin-like phospholipase family protein [Metabacillus kandeliae]
MYIDGVFSGGGIKGLALIGACQAVEMRGFRFARMAGTSAGAIIAAFLAAGYTSDEIMHLMEDLELKEFLDERKALFPFRFIRWISIYWRLGLYKGNKLEAWVAEKLRAKGISVFGDIPAGRLRIIASDLTNGKMIVLPDDLLQYGLSPDRFSVARAVRMSCSLPYFFEPVKLTASAGRSIVVDGGVLSNFPIWLFTEEKIRIRPVIGFKLSAGDDYRPKKQIRNAFEMYTALFETMKDAHDTRHILQKHEKNIVFIPVDYVVTTEFEMTAEKKLALIELGRERTFDFLKKWTY